MTVFVHSIVIICFKFLFVDRLGPTATLIAFISLHAGEPINFIFKLEFGIGQLCAIIERGISSHNWQALVSSPNFVSMLDTCIH